jgi:hypothetical protein
MYAETDVQPSRKQGAGEFNTPKVIFNADLNESINQREERINVNPAGSVSNTPY